MADSPLRPVDNLNGATDHHKDTNISALAFQQQFSFLRKPVDLTQFRIPENYKKNVLAYLNQTTGSLQKSLGQV